jgi:DNA-binding Lrp family transcriptional regulator
VGCARFAESPEAELEGSPSESAGLKYVGTLELFVMKGLTRNERIVLYGLVRYPTLNDRELSEEMNVKHSTITAIRRRLYESRYFKTVRIPAVNRLGYELIVVRYGKFSHSAGDALRDRFVDSLRRENKGLYYLVTSPGFFFHVSAVRNYTSYRRWVEAIEFEFAETDLFREAEGTSVVFPFETSMHIRHFDYSWILRGLFDIRDKAVAEAPFQRIDVERLTKKERTVLSGLVEHPEDTDVALSERIDASRQVISTMRKKFEGIGLTRTARIVDLRKLGYEILAFGHINYSRKLPLSLRTEGIQRSAQQAPQFLNLSSNSETVGCGAFKNYDEHFKAKKGLLSFYTEKRFLDAEPRSELIALSEANIRVNCDFSSLIKEAVESMPK